MSGKDGVTSSRAHHKTASYLEQGSKPYGLLPVYVKHVSTTLPRRNLPNLLMYATDTGTPTLCLVVLHHPGLVDTASRALRKGNRACCSGDLPVIPVERRLAQGHHGPVTASGKISRDNLR
jgi:hypothetical protein